MGNPSYCCCNRPGVCQLYFEDTFNENGSGLNGAPVNWGVDQGPVDLIGQPTIGKPFFDLLPGNGMYVDLAGTFWPVGAPQLPGILTYFASYCDGVNLFLQVDLAGNQRQDLAGFVVRISIIDPTNFGAILATRDITIDDWKQPFTTYTLRAIVVGNACAAPKIEMLNVPAGRVPVYGCLLNNVRFWSCPADVETPS